VWMKFPLTSKGEIRIATTRPELLVACRAVIVHPEDARFAGLPGKKARVPLYGHEVPILAHPTAKPEFGSGAAMICSYGDMVDLRRLAAEMEFRPTRHRQLVLDWIDSLTIDWPISRLRYYHTEIPLWYCKKCGETLAPPPGKYYRPWKDPAPFAKCPKCSSKD